MNRIHGPLLALALCASSAAHAATGAPPTTQVRAAAQAADDDANAPYKTYDATPAITMPPLLLDVSDTSVVIEWMTDSDSDGLVRYGEHALDHTAVAQHDGLLDVGHFHRVVLEGLQPGHTYQYQVASRRVVALKPYWPERGRTVQGAVGRFATLDAARPSARFAVITDTHEKVERIHALLEAIGTTPVDFVVHDGDSVNYAVNEGQFKGAFLAPMAEGLRGGTPLLYVRGNHEYRGPFARALGPYLHAQDGRYDYARDAGPVHLIALDTGEDKPDATNVYAGLNDLRDYRAQTLDRFRHALADVPRVRSAPFTVLLGHQKDFGWTDGHNDAWMEAADDAGVDLFIAGHEHRFEHIAPGTRGNAFPILVVGQDQFADVQATARALTVTVTDLHGRTIDRFTLMRKRK